MMMMMMMMMMTAWNIVSAIVKADTYYHRSGLL